MFDEIKAIEETEVKSRELEVKIMKKKKGFESNQMDFYD